MLASQRMALAALAALVLAGAACASSKTAGTTGASPTGGRPGATAGAGVSASPGPVTPARPTATSPEAPVTGDIPDNQLYVTYTPAAGPSGGFSLRYPDGWARTEANGVVTFTDRLNSLRIETTATATAPTLSSVQANELPAVQSAARNFQLGKVSAVQRSAGAAILVTYNADAPADAVTGKVVRDDLERYAFWHNGKEVILTVAGPAGSDNVDPWRKITDSLVWVP